MKLIARATVRDCVVTHAELQYGQHGGYVICKTNKTGRAWVNLSRGWYYGLGASRFGHNFTPDMIVNALTGLRVNVRIEVKEREAGHSYYSYDVCLIPGYTQDQGEYNLGDGGHG